MYRRRSSLLMATVIAACIWGVSTAIAQNLTGTISGAVVDEHGQPVPGATVTVINEGTHETRVTVTETTGAFQVTNLLTVS